MLKTKELRCSHIRPSGPTGNIIQLSGLDSIELCPNCYRCAAKHIAGDIAVSALTHPRELM